MAPHLFGSSHLYHFLSSSHQPESIFPFQVSPPTSETFYLGKLIYPPCLLLCYPTTSTISLRSQLMAQSELPSSRFFLLDHLWPQTSQEPLFLHSPSARNVAGISAHCMLFAPFSHIITTWKLKLLSLAKVTSTTKPWFYGRVNALAQSKPVFFPNPGIFFIAHSLFLAYTRYLTSDSSCQESPGFWPYPLL